MANSAGLNIFGLLETLGTTRYYTRYYHSTRYYYLMDKLKNPKTSLTFRSCDLETLQKGVKTFGRLSTFETTTSQ